MRDRDLFMAWFDLANWRETLPHGLLKLKDAKDVFRTQ